MTAPEWFALGVVVGCILGGLGIGTLLHFEREKERAAVARMRRAESRTTVDYTRSHWDN